MVTNSELLAICLLVLSAVDSGVSGMTLTRAGIFAAARTVVKDPDQLFLSIIAGTVTTSVPFMTISDIVSVFIVQLVTPYFKQYNTQATIPILLGTLFAFSALGTLFGYDVRQPFVFLSLGIGLAIWNCSIQLNHKSQNHDLRAAIETIERYKSELEKLKHSKNFQTFKQNPITSVKMKRIVGKLKGLEHKVRHRSNSIQEPVFEMGAKFSPEIEQEQDDFESISEFYMPTINSDEEEAIAEIQQASHDSGASLSADEVDDIINSMMSKDFGIYKRRTEKHEEANDTKKRLTQAVLKLSTSSNKIYKELANISRTAKKNIPVVFDCNEDLTELLEQVGDWDFNTLVLVNYTHEPLTKVGTYVFNTMEFNERFQIPREVSKKFLSKVESCYLKANYYHNSLHAADVVCSVVFLIHKGLQLCCSMSEIDIFALIVAALAHDVAHPGINNAYLIATSDILAMQYNDQSVLENMHCSMVFKILSRADYNILASLNKGDQQAFRKIVIKTILATDLQKHFDMVRAFRARIEETDLPSLDDEKFRHNALELCVKCADLGHGAKKLPIHKEWSALITKEFYAQGDLEEKYGLPVSSLNSRSENILSSSQQGFLNVIVKPLFEVWEDFVKKYCGETEETGLLVQACMQNIRENLIFWGKEHQLYLQGKPTFEIDDSPPLMLRIK